MSTAIQAKRLAIGDRILNADGSWSVIAMIARFVGTGPRGVGSRQTKVWVWVDDGSHKIEYDAEQRVTVQRDGKQEDPCES